MANYPSSGSGWRTSTSASSTTSPSTVPSIPVTPYEPPAYDYGRLESLTQQFASPALSRLRRGVREATMTGQYEENPAVRAMMARRSLEGYGTGLGSALASARGTAASVYGTEYQTQADAARRAAEERWARERMQMTASQTTESRLQRPTGGGLRAPSRLPHTVSYVQHDPLASVRTGSSSGGTSPGGGGGGGTGQVSDLSFRETPQPTLPSSYTGAGIFDERGKNITSDPYYN